MIKRRGMLHAKHNKEQRKEYGSCHAMIVRKECNGEPCKRGNRACEANPVEKADRRRESQRTRCREWVKMVDRLECLCAKQRCHSRNFHIQIPVLSMSISVIANVETAPVIGAISHGCILQRRLLTCSSDMFIQKLFYENRSSNTSSYERLRGTFLA